MCDFHYGLCVRFAGPVSRFLLSVALHVGLSCIFLSTETSMAEAGLCAVVRVGPQAQRRVTECRVCLESVYPKKIEYVT